MRFTEAGAVHRCQIKFYSVVPYQTSDTKGDLGTADIARNAREFTLLISCMAASEQSKN